MVRVTGMVLIDAKGRAVMCPPFPVAAVGTVSSETPTPQCEQGIPVNGLDTRSLKSAEHNSTHRWGNTHVEAIWNGHALTVVSQRLPTGADEDQVDLPPDAVSCPEPLGGWKLGGVQEDPGIEKIEKAVGAGFGALAMGYPHGGPTDADGSNPSYLLTKTEQVLVVGVTGDIREATAAVRTVFLGNLCVVHASATGAQIGRQNDRIQQAVGKDWSKLGIITIAVVQRTLGTSSNVIDVVVDTPALSTLVASIPGPAITVNPWIKPIG